MGYLKINKLIYSGKEYFYESPAFTNGINVIEGPNKSGKSTLIDLICYSLGCYVGHFNVKNDKIHEEICKDSDNFVCLQVEIDNTQFWKDYNESLFDISSCKRIQAIIPFIKKEWIIAKEV